MNIIQRLLNFLPLPFSFCYWCQCLHWHSEFEDEQNGAAYGREETDIKWNGKYTSNDSNYIYGCLDVRREIQQNYQDRWDEYYGSRF